MPADSELERDLQAFQLRELERVNPKLARKMMYLNPQLLEIRRQAALEALRRRVENASNSPQVL